MAQSNDQVKNWWVRFAEAKFEMPAPMRDTDAYKYKYADLAQIRSIVMPVLNKHGLDVVQVQRDGKLYTTLIDYETGNTPLIDERDLLTQGTDQQRGSSETYQRRYALMTICGLAPEDDDGAEASKQDTPVEEPLIAAKHRLWAAIRAYAAKHNADANKLLEGVQKRDNYKEDVNFFIQTACEFEKAD